MKLLLQWAMIFFGTLMVAALIALGEPRSVERPLWTETAGVQSQLQQPARAWLEEATPLYVPPLMMGWHE